MLAYAAVAASKRFIEASSVLRAVAAWVSSAASTRSTWPRRAAFRPPRMSSEPTMLGIQLVTMSAVLPFSLMSCSTAKAPTAVVSSTMAKKAEPSLAPSLKSENLMRKPSRKKSCPGQGAQRAARPRGVDGFFTAVRPPT